MNEQAVVLVDRINPWWYVAAFILPIVGAVAGIVYMAKSKIGPSLALFMTSYIAFTFWVVVLVMQELNS
jgi:hypothetical protein